MNTPARRAVTAVTCTVLLAGSAGCTGAPSKPAAAPSPSRSTGSTATLAARPVPLDVRVTRVSGRLKPASRRALEANVGKTLSRYLDAAFLGGRYPRSDFSASLAGFSPGVRHQAHQDRWLLTNKSLGPTTEKVTPKQQSAYLSVLAPYQVAAGVTARLRLRFVAERGQRPAEQVTVQGRLVLTRKKTGWMIIGYHLSRSVKPVGKGS